MRQDERLVAGVDYDEGEPDPGLEDDEQPCGEGMCQCSCAGGHVCGCDCWRCPYCQQLPEDCDCEEDG